MRKTLAAVLRALAARLDPPAPPEMATASTQFAGSGLVVRMYGGCDCDVEAIAQAVRAGLRTV